MNKKIIIYIIIIIIVFVIAGVGLFVLLKNSNGVNSNLNINNSKPSPTPIVFIYEPTQYDKENCAKTKEEAGCLKIGFYNWSLSNFYDATKEDNLTKCNELVESKKEACIYSVAITSNVLEFCAGIKAQAGCEMEIVSKQNSWDACKVLTTSDSQRGCFGLYINNNKIKGEALCDTVPKEDKALCLEMYYMSMASGSYNPFYCEKLADLEAKRSCYHSLPLDFDKDLLVDVLETGTYHTDEKNKDTDGDGLMDGEEVFKYKTNPLKADTDGDGYSDGEEIKSGHDPLGK